MIQVGDLVKSTGTGEIGIITRMADGFSHRIYYYVQFHDGTFVTHIQNLELLETK